MSVFFLNFFRINFIILKIYDINKTRNIKIKIITLNANGVNKEKIYFLKDTIESHQVGVAFICFL